jgi:SAM-dependent methyltransferase
MPANPFEVLEYYKQHGELPYTNGEVTNWFYDCFVEYQKRAGVHNSQYFTPTKTAKDIAWMLKRYAHIDEVILEPCCGFGQITQQILKEGYKCVYAFDNDERMIEACESLFAPNNDHIFREYDYTTGDPLIHTNEGYYVIVSNPPYETKELTQFLEYVREKLIRGGHAILLIPCGFLDKTRPARLVQILNDFSIIEREPMEEKFERTGTRAEIVVLQKI